MKPAGDRATRLRVLVTVKAAPNPSEAYGETVCVAGLRLDLDHPGWVRLYPINYRELAHDSQFKKYDVVSLEAKPARNDPRPESWRPQTDSFTREKHLKGWEHRKPYVLEYAQDTMCGLLHSVRTNPPGKSLGALRPKRVRGVDIEPHPGWSRAEQAKIDKYMNQLTLDGGPRWPLEAPRFKAWYRYDCQSPGCNGHRQSIIDWELVALQRNLADRDDAAAREEIQQRFLREMCADDRDVIFYVGNQVQYPQTFMVLGVFYPRR